MPNIRNAGAGERDIGTRNVYIYSFTSDVGVYNILKW